MKRMIMISTSFFFGAGAFAQWSTDPAQNLQILRGSVQPQMVSDGAGGAITVGVSFTARPHLYAQRVDRFGQILWSQNLDGIQISNAGIQQAWLGSDLRHLVIGDGAGGVYVAFHAFWVVGQLSEPPEEIYTYRVYVQHLDAHGNLLFGSEGLPVLYRAPVDTSGQILEALISNDSGGIYVVFSDHRSLYKAEAEWYVSQFEPSGAEVWGALRLPETSYYADLICYGDGNGGICIYGRDVEFNSTTGWLDRFRRISPSGELIMDEEINISAKIDGLPPVYDFVHQNGEAIFVWQDFRADTVRMQKLDQDGNKLWGTQPVFYDYSLRDFGIFSFTAPDYQGGMFIYNRSSSSVVGAKLRHVLTSSEITWEKQIQVIKIDSDLDSNLFYLTTSFPSPEKNIHKLNLAGQPVWDAAGVILSTRRWDAFTSIISDEEGGAIICWDETIASRGIWAQQVNSEGKLGTVTAVERRNESRFIPANRLHPNFPNPFNAETTFFYEIASISHVELTIYDLLGSSIRTLVNEDNPQGKYKISWDGQDAQKRGVPTGVYFVRFKANDESQVHKLVLIR